MKRSYSLQIPPSNADETGNSETCAHLRAAANLELYKKNPPRQTIRPAPRRTTAWPSLRTICAAAPRNAVKAWVRPIFSPPGGCTRTGDSAFPDTMAAIAVAHDPVPED